MNQILRWRELLPVAPSPSILPGVRLATWIKLLSIAKFRVELRYLPRAIAITLCAMFNSVSGAIEHSLFSDSISKTTVPPPLFILGHWRSGTTLLHNLLASDEQFSAPSLLDVLFPFSCITLRATATPIINAFLGPRPSDDTPLTCSTPYEDEFALATASGLSAQLSMVFPCLENHFDRFVSLRHATHEEQETWEESLVWFVKKMMYKDCRPLVLKSPAHTARIPRLLKLFPDAKFIHVVRNPFRVFQSTRATMERSLSGQTLQTRQGSFDDRVISQYQLVYDAYLHDRQQIPDGKLAEIRFEDFCTSPVTTIGKVYEELQIPNTSQILKSKLRSTDFSRTKNRPTYGRLSHQESERITLAWGRYFSAFGYSTSSELVD